MKIRFPALPSARSPKAAQFFGTFMLTSTARRDDRRLAGGSEVLPLRNPTRRNNGRVARHRMTLLLQEGIVSQQPWNRTRAAATGGSDARKCLQGHRTDRQEHGVPGKRPPKPPSNSPRSCCATCASPKSLNRIFNSKTERLNSTGQRSRCRSSTSLAPDTSCGYGRAHSVLGLSPCFPVAHSHDQAHAPPF